MRWVIAVLVLGACDDGGGARPPCQPVSLTTRAVSALQLAADDGFVYWSEDAPSRIVRAARPRGAPQLLDMPEHVLALQVGMTAVGGNVFWTAQLENPSDQTGIFTTSPTGQTTGPIVRGCFSGPLVVDGGTIYGLTFACSSGTAPQIFALASDGTVKGISLPGGAQGLVAGDGAAQTAVNGQLVSFRPDGTQTTLGTVGGAFPIARDATTIFLASGSEVQSIPATGGTPTTIGHIDGLISTGAVSATHVFAAGGGTGDMFALPRAGGTDARFIATLGSPSQMVATDDSLYWATAGSPPSGGVFQLDSCAYE